MRVGLLVCLAGGVVTALSVPPFGWWPLGPVGLAVLAWQLGERSWRQRIALAEKLGATVVRTLGRGGPSTTAQRTLDGVDDDAGRVEAHAWLDVGAEMAATGLDRRTH